jgi:hypothetical protein
MERRPDLTGPVRPSDLRLGEEVRGIVIHRNTVADLWRFEHPEDAELRDVDATAKWYADPKNKWRLRLFPYHILVESDGTVVQVHDFMVKSPHDRGRNRDHIGVAMCHDGRESAPPEAILRGVVSACRNVVERFPRVRIVGHSLQKRCPGEHVDVPLIERMVTDGAMCTEEADRGGNRSGTDNGGDDQRSPRNPG